MLLLQIMCLIFNLRRGRGPSLLCEEEVEEEDKGTICGIQPLQTCWAGFWVIKIPPLLTSPLQSHSLCPKRQVGSCPPARPCLPLLYLSLSLSLLSHCCRPHCFVCESGRRFSRNFLWLSLWLSRASVSVTLSPLAFSFPYPDVITTNPPRRHRSRKSSLIFVFFCFLPNSPLVTSPLSLQCLLPLSPAKRVRRYSLECHFYSNLR